MIKLTEQQLKSLVKHILIEDRMSDREITLHKPVQGAVGEMGVDPKDLDLELSQQFTQTGHKIVDLWRSLRILREIAAEMSDMEAEGFIEGDVGTRMHNKLENVTDELRNFVYMWNNLDK